MPLVIADIGSCHMGKLTYAKEAIFNAKIIGIDVLKFQLFKGPKFTEKGNIELPYAMWQELYGYAHGLEQKITASVFDEDAVFALTKAGPVPYVKLSHAMSTHKGLKALLKQQKQRVMVSADFNDFDQATDGLDPLDAVLYCISEYPVPYRASFTKVFPQFHGFSDHTMGYDQTIEAVQAGAKIIEKHVRLEHSDCPDSRFALSFSEFDSMVRRIK